MSIARCKRGITYECSGCAVAVVEYDNQFACYCANLDRFGFPILDHQTIFWVTSANTRSPHQLQLLAKVDYVHGQHIKWVSLEVGEHTVRGSWKIRVDDDPDASDDDYGAVRIDDFVPLRAFRWLKRGVRVWRLARKEYFVQTLFKY